METRSKASGGKVAKRLFSPSPDKNKTMRRRDGSPSKASTVSPRDPLRKNKSNTSGLRGSFRLSCLGTLLFVFLCLVAIVVTTELNYKWTEKTDFSYQALSDAVVYFFTIYLIEFLQQFFSNEPRMVPSDNTPYSHQLFGGFGAVPVGFIIALCVGASTCLCMYYDSNDPGSFPPTPVSPSPRQRGRSRVAARSRWHLGYIFAFVNFVVAFLCVVYCLRWRLGLPIFAYYSSN